MTEHNRQLPASVIDIWIGQSEMLSIRVENGPIVTLRKQNGRWQRPRGPIA